MYLLDTNVISETRKPRPHGGVLAWLNRVPMNQMSLCTFTFGELQSGVERTRRQDPALAARYDEWIDLLATTWKIIPMDDAIFREWARLMMGKSYELWEDAMIAATAKVRGLTVVTRNVRDFQHFPVSVFNPFSPHR
jgi:predicted nucleic acid-binding protein